MSIEKDEIDGAWESGYETCEEDYKEKVAELRKRIKDRQKLTSSNVTYNLCESFLLDIGELFGCEKKPMKLREGKA